MSNYFSSTSNPQYSQFIALSRYARWLEGENRRESWEETVDRYITFFKERLIDKNISEKDWKELRNGILNLEVMPSMRALMTAGEALKTHEMAGYNCTFAVVDNIRVFDEALYILMCGAGLGFSVERQFVSKLPEVAETFHPTDTTIVVGDSKKGWAKAYRELLSLLYSGQIPKWDTSKVRPAGAKLKVFGGRASGPEPLEGLFIFTVNLFKKAAGRKLTSLECHDILCKIGDVVVVGGIRRSALISLSNLSDDRMREAKMGQFWLDEPQRSLANNSACYTEKPDFKTFMKEWFSLYESKSGERGIFNRVAARKQVAKNGRRDPDHEWGCNPCCVSGDTLILTNNGYVPIQEYVNVSCSVWDGENFEEVVPFLAGHSSLYRVSFDDGTYLDCTDNHKFVVMGGEFKELKNMVIGEAIEKFDMPVILNGKKEIIGANYSQGFYSGGGTKDSQKSYLYFPKYVCEKRLLGKITEEEQLSPRKRWYHGNMLPKNFIPFDADVDSKLDWLSGLLDADGTATNDKNGNGIQIASVDKDFLLNLRLFLTTLGVKAKVVFGRESGKYELPNGKGGLSYYDCKELNRLLIGNTDTYNLVNLGLKCERLQLHNNPPQRDARRFVKVRHIEYLNEEDVFCFSNPKTKRGTFNGIVTGQSEILLRPNQQCNLSEVVVRAEDDLDSLKRKVRLATIAGSMQATLTNFDYVRSVWKKNAEEEALLGVSLTGVMDNDVLSGRKGKEILIQWLTEMREEAIRVNKKWATKLGINQSTAITTNKPSGTVSQLVDSASGIHDRFSPYYIRRVRADKKDPLAQFMKDKGFPYEDDIVNPSNYVFSFPIKAPESAGGKDSRSAIEQLEHWKIYQENWTEHKPSVTIYYSDDEFLGVGQWVWENFDLISGISFLPRTDHVYQQAPYEEITKDKYEELTKVMPKNVDWSKLSEYEKEDTTTGTQTLACSSGGVCEIVDVVK